MTALRGFLRPIRLGAAMALVCALCLPLSQCSQGGNAVQPPAKQTLLSQFFPQTNKEVTYQYAVAELDLTPGGMGTLLAFTWPLLFVFAGGKLTELRFSWILHLLELILCAGTLYWLIRLTLFGDWLYGAYVVLISIGLLACTALVFLSYSLWGICRKLRDKTRGSGHQPPAIADPAPSG